MDSLSLGASPRHSIPHSNLTNVWCTCVNEESSWIAWQNRGCMRLATEHITSSLQFQAGDSSISHVEIVFHVCVTFCCCCCCCSWKFCHGPFFFYLWHHQVHVIAKKKTVFWKKRITLPDPSVVKYHYHYQNTNSARQKLSSLVHFKYFFSAITTAIFPCSLPLLTLISPPLSRFLSFSVILLQRETPCSAGAAGQSQAVGRADQE